MTFWIKKRHWPLGGVKTLENSDVLGQKRHYLFKAKTSQAK